MQLELTPQLLVLVPVVVGLVTLAKIYINSRYAPLISLALGIGGVYLLGTPIVASILPGVLVGLTAAGLYSGTKTVAGY